MRKYAMTLAEILIAMTLIVLLTVVCINTLHVNVGQDTDIMKFRHAYGSVSKVVYELKNDVTMYPDTVSGFADLSAKQYYNDPVVYSGEDKFKNLFKSKFNVYKTLNIKINSNTSESLKIPATRNKTDDSDYTYKTLDGSDKQKIECFLDNKGFMFCPPIISDSLDTLKEIKIYVPVYINKIDSSSANSLAASTGIDKAIFIEIDKKGQIDIPPVIQNGSEAIIDCHLEEQNSYNHCRVINKIADMDF